MRELLAHIDYLTTTITRLDARVGELMALSLKHSDGLCRIPGIQRRTAEIVIAEIGADMSHFGTAGHLASWAGVCPANNESAGKRRTGRTRNGDPWLESALIEAAWSAARTRGTSMQVRFWRIAKRRGSEKAAMAVAHHLLIVIWHILTDNVTYQEVGADYTTRFDDPARRQRHLVHQLEQLGLKITIEPAA